MIQPPTQVYIVTETVRDMSPQPLESAKVRGSIYFGYHSSQKKIDPKCERTCQGSLRKFLE